MLRDAEITIVGAGIMGLCTGLYLARAGRDVLILDRGDPWGESSGANAGTLGILAMPIDTLPVTRKALALWEGFGEELGADVGFARTGGLCVATTPGEVERLRDTAARQGEAGIEAEWHEAQTLREFAPWLGAAVRAAAFCSMDALSIPLQAGPALVNAVRAAGARIADDCTVTGLEALDGRIRIETGAGAVTCGALVIAAGVWSGFLARMLGCRLPIYADVNMLSITEPAPPIMDQVVTHIGGMLTVKQFSNGSCLIGGGWQGRGDVASNRRTVDYGNVVHNIRLAARVIPGLEALRVVRSWAGYEGVARDSLPLFGRLPGQDNVYITSCVRGGYLTGPAMGYFMAELILEGATSVPMDGYDPARFQ